MRCIFGGWGADQVTVLVSVVGVGTCLWLLWLTGFCFFQRSLFLKWRRKKRSETRFSQLWNYTCKVQTERATLFTANSDQIRHCAEMQVLLFIVMWTVRLGYDGAEIVGLWKKMHKDVMWLHIFMHNWVVGFTVSLHNCFSFFVTNECLLCH